MSVVTLHEYPLSISDFVKELVMFYLPHGGVIYDPTCGKENYQFKWLKGQKRFITINGYEYKYISSDREPYGDFVCDFIKGDIPLQEKSVDLVFYDPPFLMFARNDKRGGDYNVDEERGVNGLKVYYSKEILLKFTRISRKWVIIRGQDQYYPPTSYNLYLLNDLIEKPDGLVLHALHLYRVHHEKIPLIRARMQYYQRPIITHSYTYVFKTL